MAFQGQPLHFIALWGILNSEIQQPLEHINKRIGAAMVKGIHFINGRFVSGMESVELSVVIPCFNESDGIENLLREWDAALSETLASYEIIVVNDGSTDGTGRILDQLRKQFGNLRVIHQLNSGQSAAVRRGYEAARGVYVLQLDASGRYEPADFLQLWEKRAHFDLILAQRTHRLDAPIRRLGSNILRLFVRVLFGMRLQDPNVPFRLFRREIASHYFAQVKPHAISTHLAMGLLIYQNAPKRTAEVLVPYRRRPHGVSHLSVLSASLLAIPLATELFKMRLRQISPLHASPGRLAPTTTPV
jgi:dolichol-phosphate mannosyltransferase